MTPKFELRWDIRTIHTYPDFRHPVIARSEVIVLTNKQKNPKQRSRFLWKYPTFFATLWHWVKILQSSNLLRTPDLADQTNDQQICISTFVTLVCNDRPCEGTLWSVSDKHTCYSVSDRLKAHCDKSSSETHTNQTIHRVHCTAHNSQKEQHGCWSSFTQNDMRDTQIQCIARCHIYHAVVTWLMSTVTVLT